MSEKRFLSSMNESQMEAVTHGEGPLLVLAGPGSGKTFTITQRILYLLQELHIPAEQILVITFTKAAALSMQNRFKEQLSEQSEQIYPVNFGTFHSCFYHILRQSHVLQKHKLATEADKKTILKHLFFSGIPDSQSIVYDKEAASRILQAFSFYKNTNDEAGAKKKLPKEYQESFFPIFEAYEKERERRNLLDFDDMVYQCRKVLMENPQLRAYWQSRFSHILMDEFQDINPIQYEAVKLLTGERTQLFAVGDDDQSIYGFRGSEPACLKQFQEEFQAKMVHLSINYRSVPPIVESSLKVISENKQRFEKDLRSAKAADSHFRQVSLRAFEEKEEQYAYLTKLLMAFLTKKPLEISSEDLAEETPKTILDDLAETQPESIGVLFRTNSYMQGFAARLSRLGIPYEMKEKVTSIYEHFIVKDIMAYLLLAEGAGGREQLLQILNKPLRYLSREALGWQGSMKQQAIREMLEGMLLYYKSASDIAYRQERILAVEKLKKDFGILKNRPLYLKLQYILKGMGYEKHLRDRAGTDMEKWQEYQEILEWMSGEAKVYENIAMWLQAKESYEKTLKKESDKNPSPKTNPGADSESCEMQIAPKIQLMTVHASKGLEFDCVWIPDCNEKIFPHGNMPDASCCEEERRIFYVAMTRAKKSLELLYLTGTKEHPRLPSRFLNPLL